MWSKPVESKFFIISIISLALTAGLFLVPVFCLADDSPTIIINEIMYDLPGADEKHEWVEILNISDANIDLTRWRFNDGSNHLLNEPPKNGGQGSLAILAGGYAILADDAATFLSDHQGFSGTVIDTVMSLKNSSSTLKLINAEENEVDSLIYENTWGAEGNGKTLEKINPQGENNQNNWAESLTLGGTPGAQNTPSGTPPEEETPEMPPPFSPGASSLLVAEAGADIFALVGAEAQFDGSSSYTNSYRPLTYFWNFGDGVTSDEKQPKHTYKFPGKYLVSLTVSDTLSSKTDTLTATIFQEGLSVNEFLPIPDKPESSGWIELYNASEQIIDLENWQLTDKKQTKKFIFPPGSLIAPKQLLVLTEPISKIGFNSSDDSLSLIYPNGSTAQLIEYKEAKKGWSINRMSDEKYIWSATPTPGLTNLITILPLAGQEVSGLKGEIILGQATEPALETAKNYQKQNSQVIAEAPSAKDLTPVSEWPPAPDSQAPVQIPPPQETEPADTSAPESRKPLASLSEAKGTQSKTAKLILSISVVLSFVILASWAMLMLKKAVKK